MRILEIRYRYILVIIAFVVISLMFLLDACTNFGGEFAYIADNPIEEIIEEIIEQKYNIDVDL